MNLILLFFILILNIYVKCESNNSINYKVFKISELNKPVRLSFIKYDPINNDKSKSIVITVHGILSNKQYWRPICKQIGDSTNRTCYSLDLRDHYRSPFTDDFSFKSSIADLIQFIYEEKLDKKKIILIGHSLGGMLVSRVATMLPHLIDKLIILDINPQYHNLVKRDMVRKGLILQMEIYRIALDYVKKENLDLISSKLKMYEFLSTQLNMSDKQIRGYLSKLTLDQFGKIDWQFNLKTLTNYLKNLEKFDDFNPFFKGPTLLLFAEQFGLFQIEKDKQIVQKLFPNCLFHSVKGDHNFFKSNVDDFLKEAIPFIEHK